MDLDDLGIGTALSIIAGRRRFAIPQSLHLLPAGSDELDDEVGWPRMMDQKCSSSRLDCSGDGRSGKRHGVGRPCAIIRDRHAHALVIWNAELDRVARCWAWRRRSPKWGRRGCVCGLGNVGFTDPPSFVMRMFIPTDAQRIYADCLTKPATAYRLPWVKRKVAVLLTGLMRLEATNQ